MAIAARGLGLPEDGALVVGGLGTVEVDANAMSATLNGASTLTATLTADAEQPVTPPAGGGNTMPSLSFPRKRKTIVGVMAATLNGTSTLAADIDFTIDFDADLEQLLLVGAI